LSSRRSSRPFCICSAAGDGTRPPGRLRATRD
jgi:hypothetical protein